MLESLQPTGDGADVPGLGASLEGKLQIMARADDRNDGGEHATGHGRAGGLNAAGVLDKEAYISDEAMAIQLVRRTGRDALSVDQILHAFR